MRLLPRPRRRASWPGPSGCRADQGPIRRRSQALQELQQGPALGLAALPTQGRAKGDRCFLSRQTDPPFFSLSRRVDVRGQGFPGRCGRCARHRFLVQPRGHGPLFPPLLGAFRWHQCPQCMSPVALPRPCSPSCLSRLPSPPSPFWISRLRLRGSTHAAQSRPSFPTRRNGATYRCGQGWEPSLRCAST